MILTDEKESKRIIAAIKKNGIIERYVCNLYSCTSPVCTCGDIDLELVPLETESGIREGLKKRKVKININKRKAADIDQKDLSTDDLEFSELFMRSLDQNDFELLDHHHFIFKNMISEETAPDKINAIFEFEEVEQQSLMYAYNDVLPYGDQLFVEIEGEKYIIFDQYCLKHKCGCTDAHLDIFLNRKKLLDGEETCLIEVQYNKRHWTISEGVLSPPASLETFRTAVETKFPDIYDRLRKRHEKLRAIYASCKRKHYTPPEKYRNPKIGRNDPCPCGSGKKYKKCCMEKQ